MLTLLSDSIIGNCCLTVIQLVWFVFCEIGPILLVTVNELLSDRIIRFTNWPVFNKLLDSLSPKVY